MRSFMLLAGALLCHLSPALALAQVRVPDDPACTHCEIRMTTVLRIPNGAGSSSIPGRPTAMVLDSRGRYWVSSPDGHVSVFRATGEFIRSVGRPGQGPGEFRLPNLLLQAGDSIVVFDMTNARATVIGPDLEMVRTISLPATVLSGAALQWPTATILNAIGSDRDLAGWPLHVVDFSGGAATFVRSFGLDRGELRPSGQRRLMQSVSLGRSGAIWTVDRILQYRIARWSAQGTIQDVLLREPKWFRDADGLPGGPRIPPSASIQFVQADTIGRLWVFASTPVPNWKDAWAGVTTPRGMSPVEIPVSAGPDATQLYQTTLEVISPNSRRVLARQVIPGSFLPIGGSRIGSYVETPSGDPIIEVISVSLVEGPG